jgi:hypothetical protein
MEQIVDFLNAYAESLEWSERGFEAVAEKLCQNQLYSSNHNREFLMIAYGWMWAKSDQITGNCSCGLMMMKLNEVYSKIAKQNHWQ